MSSNCTQNVMLLANGHRPNVMIIENITCAFEGNIYSSLNKPNIVRHRYLHCLAYFLPKAVITFVW